MCLPLPGDTARRVPARPSQGDNIGLWLDKFVRRRSPSPEALRKGDAWAIKSEYRDRALAPFWREITGAARAWKSEAGAQGLARSGEAVRALHGDGGWRTHDAKVHGRLLVDYGRATSTEMSLSFHPTWGVPRIPASGVKGALRAYLEDTGEAGPVLDALFGGTERAGALVFHDALPLGGAFKLALDVLTPHHGKYYQEGAPPGDWMSPVPHTFLTVVDTTFRFAIGLDERRLEGMASKVALDLAVLGLREALDSRGVGAKRAAGYGRLERLP